MSNRVMSSLCFVMRMIRHLVLCVSILLNVVGINWCVGRLLVQSETESLVRKNLAKNGDDPQASLLLAYGHARIQEFRGVKGAFIYQNKSGLDNEQYAFARMPKAGADGSCVPGNKMSFVSNDMVVSWDMPHGGICSNIMICCNSGPIFYDQVGEGNFRLKKPAQKAETLLRDIKDSVRIEKRP